MTFIQGIVVGIFIGIAIALFSVWVSWKMQENLKKHN